MQILDFALRYEDNALLPRTCVISIKELSKNKACVEALIGRGLVQVLVDTPNCLPAQCIYHAHCNDHSAREQLLAIWQSACVSDRDMECAIRRRLGT